MIKILGIESSCDETAASVVADGRTILSSVVASQVEEHKNTAALCRRLPPPPLRGYCRRGE